MKIKTLWVILIIPCIISCSFPKIVSYKENAPYPKSSITLYKEDSFLEKVVLLKDKSGLREAYYSTVINQWLYTTNAELKPKEGFSLSMDNSEQAGITLYTGVITNPKIKNVWVKQKHGKHKAKIIRLENGDRAWYYNIKHHHSNKEKEEDIDSYKIEAVDKNNNILWEF